MPLELDQIYSSLDDLNVALGPDGANKKGALTDLLETTAENFGGQGAKFHQTIKNFSKLSATLDDNKEELFGSARELEGFISTLANNDKTVRQFNQSLADVSDDARRASARSWPRRCTTCRSALGAGRDLRQGEPRHPRHATSRASTGSPRCWSSSATRSTRSSTDAPVALNNLALTYNPQAGTLDTRANLGELVNQIAVRPGRRCCAASSSQADNARRRLCDLRPAGAARGRRRSASVRRPASPCGPAFDPTLGGLVEVTTR